MVFSDYIQHFPKLKSYYEYRREIEGAGENAISTFCNFAFRESNTTLCDLTELTTFFVVLCLVLPLTKSKSHILSFFSSFGRRIASDTHGKDWVLSNEEKIVKFGEYLFRLCYHFSIALYGVIYFSNREWFIWNCLFGGKGSKYLWDDFFNQSILPGMSWYYIIQSVYHVENLWHFMKISFCIRLNTTTKLGMPIVIEWKDSVRGDFNEMIFHHLVASSLIFASSMYRVTNIGTLVFMIHDISDIFVDLSKITNFLRWPYCTVIAFVNTLIWWLAFRLYFFPFQIIRSAIYEAYEVGHMHLSNYPSAMSSWNYVYYTLSSLMICLFLLHIHWFIILCRIAYTLVTKGERQDYTEYKKGEKEA